MSDYLSEEEQLERLQSWWKENGTMLLVGVVLVVGGFVGFRWYESYTAEQAEAASDLYAAYQEAEDKADKDLLLSQLATQAGGSSYHALALFAEAKQSVESGDLEAAVALYQQVLDDPSDQLVEDLARIRIAASLQGLDRSEEALSALDGIRSPGYRRAALELKGDIHVARQEFEPAHAAYSQALEAAGEGAQTQLLQLKVVNTDGISAAPEIEKAVQEESPQEEAEEPQAVIEAAEALIEETIQEETAQPTEDAP